MTRAELAALEARLARLEVIVKLLVRLRERDLTGEQRQAVERELRELAGG